MYDSDDSDDSDGLDDLDRNAPPRSVAAWMHAIHASCSLLAERPAGVPAVWVSLGRLDMEPEECDRALRMVHLLAAEYCLETTVTDSGDLISVRFTSGTRPDASNT